MTAERNKLQLKNENFVANNTVLESELIVIKKEILKEKKAFEDLTRQNLNQEKRFQSLTARSQDQDLQIGDQARKIERLENQLSIAELRMKDVNSNLIDKEEEVYELKDANQKLSSQLATKIAEIDALKLQGSQLKDKVMMRKQGISELTKIYELSKKEFEEY